MRAVVLKKETLHEIIKVKSLVKYPYKIIFNSPIKLHNVNKKEICLVSFLI